MPYAPSLNRRSSTSSRSNATYASPGARQWRSGRGGDNYLDAPRDDETTLKARARRGQQVPPELEDLLELLPAWARDAVVRFDALRRAGISDPVGEVSIETQDDVARWRMRLYRLLRLGVMDPASVNALAKILDAHSQPTDLYGGEQGVGGGSRVLRLLPGMTLVEMWDPGNLALAYEELVLLQRGQEDDVANGVEPPATIEEAIGRYLGRPRAARMEYDEKQYPEGIRELTEHGPQRISFVEMETRARARWQRLRSEAQAARTA